ncbi:MAG: FecR domain-containing protein [Bacteroidales bacterium]|nr:FecR domain-containing protein [Bacteroidales bacterium]
MVESVKKYVIAKYKEGRLDASEAAGAFRRRYPSLPVGRIAAWTLPLAASLLLGLFLFNNWKDSWTQYGPSGSQRSVVTLADGTGVTLAPGAILKLQKHRNPRKVQLEGLAFFEVARDDAHPFEIVSDGVYVKVLGTKFSLDAGRKCVSVESGKVLFATSPDGPGLILTDRMQACVENGVPVYSNGGSFLYEDTPILNVLAELGDYFGAELELTDPSAATLRLNGSFAADDLQTIVGIIEDALDVQIEIRK